MDYRERESMKYGKKERGHYKGVKSNTKDLTIKLAEGRETPYHRLD